MTKRKLKHSHLRRPARSAGDDSTWRMFSGERFEILTRQSSKKEAQEEASAARRHGWHSRITADPHGGYIVWRSETRHKKTRLKGVIPRLTYEEHQNRIKPSKTELQWM